MPAFDAIGMDAVGMSGSTSASLSGLSTTLQSVSAITAVLSTSIKLVAGIQSTSTITASLTTLAQQSARLQAVLVSQSSITGTLSTSQAIPMFIPSAARTINVQATSPVFTGGKYWNLIDPKKPRGAKDPDATIDITFDWSVWLADIGSPNISDVAFTLNGVDSVGSFSDGIKTTVFVSGGTSGSSALVACKITTATTPPRVDERTIYLDIGDE
jgi:hypothetical protein